MTADLLLAGDIGGTKTVLALFEPRQGAPHLLVEKRYPSAQYAGLMPVIDQFLRESESFLEGHHLASAVFGVAGPIENENETAEITNLGWIVSVDEIANKMSLPRAQIRLLNDLEAMAMAVPHLPPSDLQTLNPGRPDREAPIAIIAPGTGLGEAYLIHDGQQYQAFPSEGGHADFAPGDDVQLALLNFLFAKFGHVSVERVCSGVGIPNVYDFLCAERPYTEPAWLREKLAAADDRVPIILNSALDESTAVPLCRRTLEIFVSILGAEAGNLGLTFLARGGVFLGGGIPPRILPVLQSNSFKDAFLNKGRMTGIMEQIPVHVILNANTPLLGAAYAALQLTAR